MLRLSSRKSVCILSNQTDMWIPNFVLMFPGALKRRTLQPPNTDICSLSNFYRQLFFCLSDDPHVGAAALFRLHVFQSDISATFNLQKIECVGVEKQDNSLTYVTLGGTHQNKVTREKNCLLCGLAKEVWNPERLCWVYIIFTTNIHVACWSSLFVAECLQW